jgi:4-amino-4-deoxy-L-arabinose transferase-like glycosyltransferase
MPAIADTSRSKQPVQGQAQKEAVLLDGSYSLVLALIAGLALFMYVAFAANWLKFSRAEVFFAECAREMLKSNNLVTPLYHGKGFFDKPILIYWLIVGTFKTFGVGHLTARIHSIIAAVATVTITGITTTLLYRSRQAGLLAAMMLASSFMFFSFAYLCMSDMLLVLLDTISVTLLYVGIQNERRRLGLWCLAAASMGLAFLTKGPVGLVLPGGMLIAYLGITKNLAILKPRYLFPMGIIAAAIASPWFIAAYQANGSGALIWFFVRENLIRYAGATYDTHKPIWFMVTSLMSGFLPWSLLLPAALWQFVKHRKAGELSEQSRGELYLWLWIAVLTGFFSFSRGKCDYYVLPIYPAAAAITGAYVARSLESTGKYARAFVIGTAVLLLAAGAGAVYLLPKITADASWQSWAVLPAVLICGAVATGLLSSRRRYFPAYLAAFAGLVLTCAAFADQIVPTIIKQQPIWDYSRAIVTSSPDTLVAVDTSLFNWIDQITFQTDREPIEVHKPSELAKLMSGSTPVLAIVPEDVYAKVVGALQGSRTQLRVLDARKTFSHPLTPGWVFQRNGSLKDTVIMLVGNRG